MPSKLKARHGVHLFADANVTLHVALGRNVVESAGFCIRESWTTRNHWGANSEMSTNTRNREIDIVSAGLGFLPIPERIMLRQDLVREGTQSGAER